MAIEPTLARDNLEVRQDGGIGDRPLWAVRTRAPASDSGARDTPPVAEPVRIWVAGSLRLFLSHVSAHKVEVSRLKAALAVFGVSGFLAHEDIEPSVEWQREIEYALATMDALLALVTPDFHESRWTDQEVGFALGREKLVIAARVPENPYGFMGKLQGLSGDLARPEDLAARVVGVLLGRPETADKMRDGLVHALETSPSFAASRQIADRICDVSGYSPAQIARIRLATTANDQVTNAWAAMARLNRFLSELPD